VSDEAGAMPAGGGEREGHVITRIGTAPRRLGLTTEEFQQHWYATHGPLVRKLKGLRRNWQNHALLRDGEPLQPWAGFDACSEMEFDDLQSMAEAFSPEHYPVELKNDSEHLIDKSKAAPMITRRIHLQGTIDLKRVRLLTFMRCAPRCTAAELESDLRTCPSASTARARELYVTVVDPRTSVSMIGFDAVDVQWFDDPQQAERYLVSSEAREHRHAIVHRVCGVERLLARVRVVL
jgi:uncharacterized protein (TIGR02118 family)